MLLKFLMKMLQLDMSSSVSFVCFCILVLNTYAAKGAIPSNLEERSGNHLKDSISRSIYSFGTELLKGLTDNAGTNDNIFVSPLSAYIALSMVHLATGNGSRVNLNDVLQISPSNKEYDVHENLGAILKEIGKKSSDDSYDTLPEIFVANKFFVDNSTSIPIEKSYKKLLKKYYGDRCTIKALPFQDNLNATEIINSWISARTKNRIENFFSEPLSKDTSAILISTLHFNATWQKQFSDTKMEKFKTDQGETKVPMMSAKDYIPYYSNDNLQFDSIELLYKGEEYAMMVVLPHPSQTVRNLTRYIHLLDFKQYNDSLQYFGVEYKIPKMKISSKNSLVEALRLTDILEALELRALTRAYKWITIRNVEQAADLEVNESGTIATAATAVEFEFRRAPPIKQKVFVVDRPFIIYIVHKPTYTPLFSGIIHRPA